MVTLQRSQHERTSRPFQTIHQEPVAGQVLNSVKTNKSLLWLFTQQGFHKHIQVLFYKDKNICFVGFLMSTMEN